MRSIVSTANGGRPVFARGQCGSTTCTSAGHGTTRSISSRNSRLRVFFVDRFRPSPSCFMNVESLLTMDPLMQATRLFCRCSLKRDPDVIGEVAVHVQSAFQSQGTTL